MSVLLAGRVSSVYEPIVDVATKTVYGYEALARGPIGTELHSPAVLFEAAEEHRLVFELDCLCRQSGLDGAVGLPEGTHLFLNVRPTTIYDPHFRPDVVTRTLERSGLSPRSVVFEISEKESIANFAAFREIRDEYKSLGFRFALDDTGAGYASLQAVIELEPDFVKVDRSFVAGVDTDRAKQSLVRALQSVADGIGAQLVGEGLDTLEELEMLGKLSIPFGQGWLFGKPTPLRYASRAKPGREAASGGERSHDSSARGSAQRSTASERPRIACAGRSTRSSPSSRAAARVFVSTTIAASSSRVSAWSRAARLVVLPSAVQMRRSAARTLPTNAGPVAMPTPTARRRVPAPGSSSPRRAHRARRSRAPARTAARSFCASGRGAPKTAIMPSPLNSTTAPPCSCTCRDTSSV